MRELPRLGEAEFGDKIVRTGQLALVFFHPSWCQDRMRICPALGPFQERFGDRVAVYRVDFDEDAALARRYGVQSLPVLLLFNQGKLVETIPVASSLDTLALHVEPLISKP